MARVENRRSQRCGYILRIESLRGKRWETQRHFSLARPVMKVLTMPMVKAVEAVDLTVASRRLEVQAASVARTRKKDEEPDWPAHVGLELGAERSSCGRLPGFVQGHQEQLEVAMPLMRHTTCVEETRKMLVMKRDVEGRKDLSAICLDDFAPGSRSPSFVSFHQTPTGLKPNAIADWNFACTRLIASSKRECGMKRAKRLEIEEVTTARGGP